MSDCCANYFEMFDRSDSFETWAGLRGATGPMGPQGAPGRDGANVALRGPVATVGDLPDTAPAGDLWLVGEDSPYEGYFWNGERWVDVGTIATGPGVPEGGLTGQYLTKNSDDSFDTGWRSPSNADPLMDGTASPGTSTYLSRSNHRHPTDTSRAPTSHASSASTYGVGTSGNYGHVKLSDSTASTSGISDGIAATPAAVKAVKDAIPSAYTSTPAMDGTASAGSSGSWARGDHVHPSDTSRVDKSGDTISGNLTVNASDVLMKSTNVTSGTIPSTFTWGNAEIDFRDSGNTTLGIVGLVFQGDTNGYQGTRLRAVRRVNGSDVLHDLTLRIDKNGNRNVQFADVAAWRAALGIGSSGNLPILIGQGGTGQTGTESSSTVANVASVKSGVALTIESANYAKWGKVCNIRIVVKATGAVSSGTIVIVNSGLRPAITAPVVESNSHANAYILSDGSLVLKESLSSGNSRTFIGTYILP